MLNEGQHTGQGDTFFNITLQKDENQFTGNM